MKLARVQVDEGSLPALVEGDRLALLDDPQFLATPNRAVELLCSTPEVLAAAAAGAKRISLEEKALLAPVETPTKIIAVGLNYADHIAESGLETPEVPTIFAKFPSSLNGPYAAINRPRASAALDYEGELAFVIGRRCHLVPRERAAAVIAGYLVANDVSVRDWQLRSPQWSLGKSFDTHAPVGPWITSADEVDPHDLELETLVNGEPRQRSRTSHLVFDCFDLVEHLSQACTLNPGDLILTGTPAGVGAVADPPVYLAPGDETTVRIEGLGSISNVVVEEPASAGFLGGEQLPEVAAST